MKEQEAIEHGFFYTGMSCNVFDKDQWEKCKAKANQIRKTYEGADYRIVDSTCDSRLGKSYWKNIYGNGIFQRVQYYSLEKTEEWLNDGFSKEMKALEKEYQEKVEQLNEKYRKTKNEYEFIKSIKRG